MGLETPELNKKVTLPGNDYLDKHAEWRDKGFEEGSYGGKGLSDFANLNLENMTGYLDRAIEKRERGHIIIPGVAILGGVSLTKEGDVYKVSHVERYMKDGNWVQRPYPEAVEFRAEEVKALSTKHTGFYLERIQGH
jgi:hypothetical protein